MTTQRIVNVAIFAAGLSIGTPAAVSPGDVTVQVYTVTDPATFHLRHIFTSRYLIFRNGAFQSPNIDYYIKGQSAIFYQPFSASDQIEVATIP